MNNNNYDIDHPLQRNGTSQKDRVKPALDPSSIRVDERGMAELVAYAHRYAALINYFQLDNTVDGDWQFFFEVDDTTLLAIISQLPDNYVVGIPELQSDLEYWASMLEKDNTVRKNIEARLIKDFPPANIEAANKVFLRVRQDASKYFETALARDNHQPHIALFLAFLFLYEKVQNHLNEFTARHLEFFLEKVLRLERKAAVPDSVHLIFQLAETVKEHRIEKNTEFKAGKDDLGKNRFYQLVEELIATKATIAEIKTIFIDKENNDQLRVAPLANSLDGLGTEFEDETTGWPTFGDPIAGQVGEPGIAIASPILYMQEGNRLTTLTFNLFPAPIPASLLGAFRVFLTTPEGWLELAEISNAAAANNQTNTGFTPSVSGGKILINMKLHFGDPAIDLFDPAIFSDGFNSHFPTVKVLLNADANNYAYRILKDLRITSVKIKVDCKGISSLIIQNDFAEFKPGKAFQPFGNSPKIGANLYLGSGEVFYKTLTALNIHIDWEGLPNDFEDYYDAYPGGIKNDSFKAKFYMLERKNWRFLETTDLFSTAISPPLYLANQSWNQVYTAPITQTIANPLLNVSAEDLVTTPITVSPDTNIQTENLNTTPTNANLNFTANLGNSYTYTPYSGDYVLANSSNLGLNPARLDDTPRTIDLPPSIKRLDSKTLSGFLRLQLNGKDFQHATYPVLYAQAMIQEAKKVFDGTPEPAQAIPNLPYTPTIRNIYLDYESEIDITFTNTQAAYNNRVERAFYVNPYGWEEAHPYILGAGNQELRFFPLNKDSNGQTYEGQLFLGVQNLEPQSVLSILFQILEGSGDPDANVPTIDWHYLVDNKWIPFNDSMILSDTTNTLLQSGVIQIEMPKKIKSGSTILNGDLIWLRAAVSRPGNSPLDPDYRTIAFPKILSIQAQAGLALFDDRGNDLSHLASSLPAGTISKMVVRDTNVKTVSQPYASFGGRLTEEADAFYRRTSEYLRHKGRAITIWDYEHMILEEFPAIYKVKCLSHYNRKNANSPGHVTVGIIPDLSNKNAVDPYRPRVDVNTRSQIEAFLQSKVSPFILCNLHVVNPTYERVKVFLKVAFRKGFDSHGFYKKELNETIKNYLAPWASSSEATIAFGGQMYKSEILYFIENLEYVDYITDFRVDHFWLDSNDNSEQVDSNITTIKTKTPLSILTTYVSSIVGMLDHSIEVLATTGDQEIICEEKNC